MNDEQAVHRGFTPTLMRFGLLLAATIGIAALVWYVLLPHHRPGLNAGETYGVDVSNHQGDIDWIAVANDDVDWAYIKASEGGDYVDAWFEQNWSGAADAGLDIGAYHFFTLCRTGADQAANFLDVVPASDSIMPAALDLEMPGNCADRPSTEWVHAEVDTWLATVEAETGQPPLLYVGPIFEDRYGILDAFPQVTWNRKILRRPADDRWSIWQLSYFAAVDGINGGVDLNIMRPGR